MTIDDFLINKLSSSAFAQPNFAFWVRTVIDAMKLLGPETDNELEKMIQVLVDYYGDEGISAQTVDGICQEIVRLGIDLSARNNTPLGLKYCCIRAIASSQETNLNDLYDWQYGVVTAFQLINFYHDKDNALIALIHKNALKYGVHLYEAADSQ